LRDITKTLKVRWLHLSLDNYYRSTTTTTTTTTTTSVLTQVETWQI
jgi:hypothetical protein